MNGSIRSGIMSALTLSLAVSVLPARELSIDERVTAQKAIEQVYWSHRLWPKENPGAKPPLAAVMSDQAIRAKVDDYLRKSNALERFWQRPVTAEQLQAELDRMAKNTRDGATLQELFGALGNDPFVIAETLGRQSLAERLIRNWYANDIRFHGDVKQQAEASLAACASVDCVKVRGGVYRETTWKLRAERAVEEAEPEREHAVLFEAEEWADHLSSLASRLGGTANAIPTGRRSGLEETPEAFVVTSVLAQSEGELKTASVSWPKRTFDRWWEAERGAVSTAILHHSGIFTLPNAPRTTCVNDTWTPTPLEVPDSRESHSAVWTGTEMIVWSGTSAVNTGGRYTPSTDTWAPTSTGNNVPAARDTHTAVWTGTEMIVWGGYSSSHLNTGGRYNPGTDSWTATSTGASVPSARAGHTAVWTGSQMIVWGGENGFGLASGGRYTPSTDTWTSTSMGLNVPGARYFHSAIWTETQMIVWGGWSGAYTNTGGRYNPTTDTWTPTSTGATVPAGRGQHAAVWTGTQMIVWGGWSGVYLNSGGRYSPSTDTWTLTSTGANVPVGRVQHTAVWTGTQMIVWGGDDGGIFFSTGARYTPASDTWLATSTGANVPAVRSRHTAVWTGTEMIVWGGGNDESYWNTGGRYTPASDTWIPTSTGASAAIARHLHTAVWTGTEMIVWGGDNGGDLNTGGRFSPATDSWTATSTAPSVPAARSQHTAVWTGTEMIVWGGSQLNTGGRYSPSSNSWIPTSTGVGVPSARQVHSAVWTGTQMIVWGGSGVATYLNTGGRYAPSTDSWTATSTGGSVPVGRSHHAAVWTGTEMIVWGGQISLSFVNTGGRYNPSGDSWIPTSTGANVPAARYGHVAVWTGAEMIVWGGIGSGGSLNTGGKFIPSPAGWTTTSAGAGVPSVRSGHVVVWTGAEMIVWGGGSLNTGGRYDAPNDVWTTTSTGTDVPRARSYHAGVWTGTQMIVWGGRPLTGSGGLYCACPNGGTYFRDVDGDGYGNRGVSTSVCAGSIPVGYVADFTDCNDASFAIHPGAPELCNSIDDDCDTVVPITEADADGDGVRVCGGDCNDGNSLVYPGAPEVNDGLDNQCAGEPGYGMSDEIAGVSGFFAPSDDTLFSWPAQAGAASYEVARSPFGDFHAGCVNNVTASTSWSDPTTPAPGTRFFYLVRSASPFVGSWGQRKPVAARIVCSGCVSTGDWCDDGSVCTAGDTCTGTICGGATVSCDDAQVCTDDSCSAVSGCVHTNNTAPCTDGSVCTINDACSSGSCGPGTPLNCDDGNPCTNDSCNPVSGCVHSNNTAACNDGNACTTGDVCQAGVCNGTLPTAASHLVISQLQVEGTTGSDEFIELYNPTAAPIALSGLSLQFKAGNAGMTTFTVHPLGTSGPSQVPSRGWILVAPSGYDGTPARNDLLSAFNLNSSQGHVFLVANTTPLSGACPSSALIIDKVGWGSANCPEGSTVAAPSANNSILRKPGGACGNGIDTDSNSSDFLTQAPSTPRNAASTPQP